MTTMLLVIIFAFLPTLFAFAVWWALSVMSLEQKVNTNKAIAKLQKRVIVPDDTQIFEEIIIDSILLRVTLMVYRDIEDHRRASMYEHFADVIARQFKLADMQYKRGRFYLPELVQIMRIGVETQTSGKIRTDMLTIIDNIDETIRNVTTIDKKHMFIGQALVYSIRHATHLYGEAIKLNSKK